MNAQDVLKTYAIFYVSENDDFDSKKKLDMLNFIEQADESMLMDLFENGEIESPEDLITEMDEKDASSLIGEAAIMCEAAQHLMESDNLLEVDLKNQLKDMLGMQTDLKYKIAKATGSAKKALQNQLSNVQDKIGDLRDQIAKGVGKAVKAGGEALEKGKEMAGDVASAAGKKISKAAETAKEYTDTAGKAIEKGVKSAGKAVEKGVETGKELASQAGEKVAGAASKAAEYAQGHPGMVGAAVAAAAALTAGVMAYRKFFSKAAQACKSAPDKKACMAQYKMKAKQAQIAAINAGKAKCAKSRKPEQCKAKIDAKINAIKAKMRG